VRSLRYAAIVCGADLGGGLKKLAVLGDFQAVSRQARKENLSHSLVTLPAEKTKITQGYMAEGARFELADELPHLRFSRPTGAHLARLLKSTERR